MDIGLPATGTVIGMMVSARAVRARPRCTARVPFLTLSKTRGKLFHSGHPPTGRTWTADGSRCSALVEIAGGGAAPRGREGGRGLGRELTATPCTVMRRELYIVQQGQTIGIGPGRGGYPGYYPSLCLLFVSVCSSITLEYHQQLLLLLRYPSGRAALGSSYPE